MKETRITVPECYEVEKIKPIEGAIIVTYKEKERKLPKSWEEFCEMFPIKGNEKFITNGSYIDKAVGCQRDSLTDKNLLPDRATAEAVLALCQLIQLRDCFNGDWVPDWNDNSLKYAIDFNSGKIDIFSYLGVASLLYFKTKDLRDEFLRNFLPLIEKLKPLYGVKEGGEE